MQTARIIREESALLFSEFKSMRKNKKTSLIPWRIKSRLIDLRNRDFSVSEICKSCGIGQATFYRWLDKSRVTAVAPTKFLKLAVIANKQAAIEKVSEPIILVNFPGGINLSINKSDLDISFLKKLKECGEC